MQLLFNRIKRLEPIPTGHEVNDSPLSGIKAVLFDIYGTLLISASGDIGSSHWKGQSVLEVFDEFNINLCNKIDSEALGLHVVHCFEDAILSSHQKSKEKGLPYPEIDIITLWTSILLQLQNDGFIDTLANDLPYHKFAMSFELYNNPVYPMPGMKSCLEDIHNRGIPLGVISNAQYFTPMILKHFFDVNPICDPLPFFHERLQVYSFTLERAKPDIYLYQLMAQNLRELGLRPHECLYVGNDLLNDISPAAEAGFKTVLFAGDERSLRLRKDHPRCLDCKPDRSIIDLSQLINILD